MINILVFNISLHTRAEEQRNYSHTQNLLKWRCLASSDRGPRKFKVKMGTSRAEPNSGPSGDLLMCRCHQSNYMATHELPQVYHSWERGLTINLCVLANCKSHLVPGARRSKGRVPKWTGSQSYKSEVSLWYCLWGREHCLEILQN